MAKTIQVIADRAYDPSSIVAAGEVIELQFDNQSNALSLRAAKLFHLLLDAAGAEACEDKTHSVSLVDLDYLRKLPFEDTISIGRELVRTTIRFDRVKDGKQATAIGPMFSLMDRDADAELGTLRFRLSPVLLEIMEASNHWAALKRQVVLAFTSRYGLRLYEMIALRKNMQHKASEVFELAELRDRLGVPAGKLLKWSNLKQKALDPAIAEVNQLSGFTVSYEPVKRSRSVVAVRLSWDVGTQEDRAKTAKELQGSKVGRKARRNGTAETPVLAFPASGSIEFSKPWNEIARLHGGGKDKDLIAADFRTWCQQTSIPLDKSGIEKTFEGFCKRVKL
nr:replication initiation protein [Ruegeria lacuscaerulensis]